MDEDEKENHGEEFAQAFAGAWRKENPFHYKEVVNGNTECTIKGRYMEITIDKVLENFSLTGEFRGEVREFTLFHVIFKNLHQHILCTQQTGSITLIDSDGNQYEDQVGLQYEYGKVSTDKAEEPPDDAFPNPDLEVRAGAKTQGWLYFRKLPKGLHPKRLIIEIRVFDAGVTSGWVRDQDTFEFTFSELSKKQ
jgi:hypothetical protein